MDYVLSPLVTAMLEGAICFIDEIGKIRPGRWHCWSACWTSAATSTRLC